ncbi:formylglycine-generating enzyme family protein, partial [candidate division CSSED10-310 bacterium]
MKITKLILIIVGIVLFINNFSCLDKPTEQDFYGSGQVMFTLKLTKEMIEMYEITHVRLTVYRGSTSVFQQEYGVTENGATIRGLVEDCGYYILAEAITITKEVKCHGKSDDFCVYEGDVTDVGNIVLECIATPTTTPTPTSTLTPTPFPGNSGDLYAIDTIVGNLRLVKAGTFTQGSPSDENCRKSNEDQFTHTLTRNLAVMENEVTRQMWADLKAMQSSLPSDLTKTDYGSGMNNPAQNMNWSHTILFANLLSIQQDLTRCYYKDAEFTIPVDSSNYSSGSFYCDFSASGFRLLSEGEWEYACRSGTTTAYNSGQNNTTCNEVDPNLDPLAWYGYYFGMGTHPVGTKQANSWNLYDMHGNVWEWCWDWFSIYPEDSTDYTGPSSGSGRLARGGGWNSSAEFCRSAFRYSI